MYSKNLRAAACAVGVLAASLVLFGVAASGSTSGESRTSYSPVQGIHQDFGSKSLSGYFLSRDSRCAVTLMVMERGDPDAPSGQTATRLRLTLAPGQIAGLDSEEGQSVNVTCSDDATRLLVASGSRERLAVLQRQAARSALAEAQSSTTR